MRQIRGQRRKKRQKDSENRHVARAERSRAGRSGFLLFRPSVRPFPFFLSFPIFSLFRFGQSVSLSLLVSLFLSLSPGSLQGAAKPRDTVHRRRGDRLLGERAHYFPAASSSRAESGLRPYYSRAARREETARTRITPRLPSSTYAGSLEYENILRSSLSPGPPRRRSRRSSQPSLLLPARFQPHASIRGSLARSHALARWSPGAFRRARTRAPPAAWTSSTTSSYRFLRHSASRHSCQINNVRRSRRWLPRYRRGGRNGMEMRKSLWLG